jgi:hypothetical protein
MGLIVHEFVSEKCVHILEVSDVTSILS